MKPNSIFIAGSTASGKSDVALHLAEALGGEIISVDSMQVYRGLDVGTAKPSPTDRTRVPHHLIDIVAVSEAFDAAQFLRLARAAEAEVHARGNVAVFCGGTGLYFKALLDGLGEAPPADAALRAELEKQPVEALLAELKEKDPAHFEQIDQKNRRRVVRAIEVLRLSGKLYSAQRANWNQAVAQPLQIVPLFGLRRPPAELRERIDARVDEMFRRGLVDETRRLLDLGLETNRTAMQAIGYRQVVEHLRGARPLDETIELVKVRTRQFAKRQMTWFRRQLPVRWLDVPSNETAETTAGKLLTELDELPTAVSNETNESASGVR